MFSVDYGPCTVTSTATCFRSPNYPSNYALGIDSDYDYMGTYFPACTITALEAVTLSVTAFSVHTGGWWDTDCLTVNGVQYSGTTGPEGVQVAAGSTITFTSNGIGTSSGFEICSGGTGAFPLKVSQPGRGVSLRGAPVHGR